jgi:hypothetical protein
MVEGIAIGFVFGLPIGIVIGYLQRLRIEKDLKAVQSEATLVEGDIKKF